MRLDVIDNHRSRFVPVISGWHQRKMRFAVRSYQTKKNTDENPTVLSLTKTGLRVKTDLSFGKSTENYIGHQIVEHGQFVFTPRDFDATPILCGVADTPGCISNLYIVFDVSPHVDAKFLEYYFWGLKYGFEFFEKLSFGMRYSFNRTQFENIPLLHPDLAAQRKIADFLDRETARIDQLIERKQRQVELLREQQKSFATVEVTGSNYSEKSGTGLGQLPFAPSHWRVHRVATVFRESFEMGGEELPVLSVSINWGISDRELDDEDRHRIVTHIKDRNAYKRVRVGDLVYNMMRAWQGGFGVARVDGLVSPAYVVARPSEEIHAPFFEHLLRTPMWIEEFRRSSKGIADFRQRLYWEHFRQVGLVLPPLEEQVEIANRIAANDAEVEAVLTPIRASIERLAEFRSALITSAVTGQIDVMTWGQSKHTDHRLDQIEEDIALREARA
ncbi:Restriction endonuclease S subunit [Paracoccus isoporae]|uniref:Restriction endonuclease S subunit n=1 Tax=Paracoccus isoporae TaxID=591205 RepID=A0A1G7GR68_9RHOB|nr:restriction endonuclease subunit S [Paracoccus isoporae]SDE90581.1 Restriction endonuclease S subunit [Paracoccus isoporae]